MFHFVPAAVSSIFLCVDALMRSQNPPQAYLDKALATEKYLRPAVIASIYAVAAILWAVFICLAFVVVVNMSAASATPIAITIVVALALIPAVFAVTAWFMRPDDLLSNYLTRYANMWRIPIEVAKDHRLFKLMLMTGEAIGIDITFYYPAKEQTDELRERLYTLTHAALSSVCSMRNSAPSEDEVEETIEPKLDTVAREFDLPILYSEVRDIGQYPEAYTIGQDEFAQFGGVPSPQAKSQT